MTDLSNVVQAVLERLQTLSTVQMEAIITDDTSASPAFETVRDLADPIHQSVGSHTLTADPLIAIGSTSFKFAPALVEQIWMSAIQALSPRVCVTSLLSWITASIALQVVRCFALRAAIVGGAQTVWNRAVPIGKSKRSITITTLVAGLRLTAYNSLVDAPTPQQRILGFALSADSVIGIVGAGLHSLQTLPFAEVKV